MKKLYYRTQKVSSRSLIALACIAIAVVIGLRWMPSRFTVLERYVGTWNHVPDLADRMVEASHRTSQAYDAIHCRRVQLGHAMLDVHDPADTGMIGPSMSLVTSLPGHLDAKLTSVNPNFAAVAMRLMVDAGVRPGDRIAIGCTGSFPALNIAVIAAAEALEARPVLISSVASSQYGANEPDLMWPDMERLLADEGILTSRSLAVSRGGFKDRCAGMSDDTRAILEASIERSGLPLMDSTDDIDAIERRILAFADAAEDETYAVYINVGGGDASVGGTVGNDALGEGVIRPATWTSMSNWLPLASQDAASSGPDGVAGLSETDCVARRFLSSGVPVINLINTVKLAKRFGLPIASTVPIEVGHGGVYATADPRRWLALLGILIITVATALVMRPPLAWVQRMQKGGHFGVDPAKQPQWMV